MFCEISKNWHRRLLKLLILLTVFHQLQQKKDCIFNMHLFPSFNWHIICIRQKLKIFMDFFSRYALSLDNQSGGKAL